ncbi:MAG: hypothetical protein Q9181_002161 [Wetmoreana brouardii]
MSRSKRPGHHEIGEGRKYVNVKNRWPKDDERAFRGVPLLAFLERSNTVNEGNSLESLQSWITRHSSIDAQDLILMTARGKQVRLQTLSFENEIFVYNRQILSASGSSSSLPTTSSPDHYEPEAAPQPPHSKEDVEAWEKLFRDRTSWAEELQARCADLAKQIQRLDNEASIIQRSAAIAVENVKQHIGNLRPKYEDSKIWADNVIQDQSFLQEQAESIHAKYSSLPAIKALGTCLLGTHTIPQEMGRNPGSESEISLYEFVDTAEVTRANGAGKASSQRFRHRANELNVAFTDVEQKANSVIDNFSRDANLSDSAPTEQGDHLLEEIQVITNKIRADRDHLLRTSHSSDTIAQMTRIALLHTRNFIPTLRQTVIELDQLLQKSVERKNDAQISGIQYLQNISTLESRIALVHSKLAKLDVDHEEGQAFEILGSVTRLPSLYGLLLVECVRRLEWTEKITDDSSTLVEEMATFKEEEFKRRRKWVKEMEGAVDLEPLGDMSLGIDINVQADKQRWPKIGREDVVRYITALQQLQGFDEAIKDIEAAFATLDLPTKHQSRRAKAFKNGSIHDTAYGRNSLLLRGDDDLLHALKGEKSKLEDKLKSSESRIRKLEDLLHRQSQISRPSSSGNPFSVQAPPVERHNTSPVIGFPASMPRPLDSVSRRSSTSSKRISTHAEPDEKSLGKRIISLEAELMAERAQSANLQKDAAARLVAEDNMRAQVREAISTKEDLLGNFEAQQREFDDERRLLEDENLKLKLRLEEAEDELDRVLGSRDHEARTHTLEEELQKIREEAERDIRSAQVQTDSVRKQHEDLQEENNTLQQKHEDLQRQTYLKSLALENVEEDHRKALQSALLHLEPESAGPDNLKGAVWAVEAALRRHKANLDEMSRLLETNRTENVELVSQLSNRDTEMQDLRDRLGNEEMEVFSTRESLAEHREDMRRLQNELDNERNEHNELKNRQQATEATVEDVKARSQSFEKQLNDLRRTYEVSDERLAKRAERAEDVTQRFYAQIGQLQKLLEQVGYTVTRQQDQPMAVQKTPKAPGTSTVLSSSGPLPTKGTSEPVPGPDYLSWATADNPNTEAGLFDQLTSDLATFDIATFHEAIIKRIKDVEHLARKWQREARNYRSQSHRFQSEAHEKIAFRSFREGDLALFLPTRNQATRPWAAFNIGAPHYFLREQDNHKLRSRDWLLARISTIEERVVDLSKPIANGATDNNNTAGIDRQSIASDNASLNSDTANDENPFELSDGLRWYLLDAAEEKPGAPISVGLGKATVAAASVDARGSSIRLSRKDGANEGATKTLTRSLDSRRSSTNSKKERPVIAAASPAPAGGADAPKQQNTADGISKTDSAGDAEEGTDVRASYSPDQKAVAVGTSSPLKSVTAVQGSPTRLSSSRQTSSIQKPSPQKSSSPDKPKPRAWNSLWSLDLNLEGGGKEKK